MMSLSEIGLPLLYALATVQVLCSTYLQWTSEFLNSCLQEWHVCCCRTIRWQWPRSFCCDDYVLSEISRLAVCLVFMYLRNVVLVC